MRYIALDLGNVVVNVDFTVFLTQLSKTLNVSMEDVNYFLNRTQKLHDMGLTLMSDELADHFGIKSPAIINDLITAWDLTISSNMIMLDKLKSLIKNGDTKIALLSNIGIEHSASMRIILTPDIFDNCIRFFSCDVGARKPSYLYYKTFLDIHPDFKGCTYLDDRIENIEAGKVFGFNAIQFVLNDFKSENELSKRLEEIDHQLCNM